MFSGPIWWLAANKNKLDGFTIKHLKTKKY